MHIKTKRGSLDNIVTYEHYCDTIDDLQQIPLQYITLGSVAIVLQGQNDGFEVYMANSNHEWVSLGTGGGGGGGDSSLVVSAPFIDDDHQFVADNASEIVDAFKSGRNVVIHFISNETSAGFGFKCDLYVTMTGYKEPDDLYPAYCLFGETLSYYGPGITDWGIEDDKLKFNIYID